MKNTKPARRGWWRVYKLLAFFWFLVWKRLGIGLTTVMVAFLFKKYVKRVPYLLGAMVCGALLCIALNGEMKGVHLLDALSGTLPPISLPSFKAEVWSVLLSGACAVALLGLIEAASIARSIAMRSK